MSTITFKLPDEVMAALEARAKLFKGTSKHLYARQVVIDHLNDTQSQQMRDELVELQNELNKLRDNIASATEILLHKAANVNQKEAASWVANTFY